MGSLLSHADSLQLWHKCTVVEALGLSCAVACGILIPPTRGQTHFPFFARWILNHWTTRKVPLPAFIWLPRGFRCPAKLSTFCELSKASKVGGSLPCPAGANLETPNNLSWTILFQFCLQGPALQGARTPERCATPACVRIACMTSALLPYNLS